LTKDAGPFSDTVAAPAKIRRDDKAMLRSAADLTRDMGRSRLLRPPIAR
jgi:hypothetical protein